VACEEGEEGLQGKEHGEEEEEGEERDFVKSQQMTPFHFFFFNFIF
jgi:hypothetical protein